MPHEKRRSLRARMITLVLIPSTALLALWALFTTTLAGDIDDLRTTATLIDEVGTPTTDVIDHLQDERRTTVAALDSPTTSADEDLATARAHTDQAVDTLLRALHAQDRDILPHQALEFHRRLNELDTHRREIDALGAEANVLDEAAAPYTTLIDIGIRVWDSQVGRADAALSADLRSLISLMRTRELLHQQNTVLAHTVATDAFTAQAHTTFAAAVGAQRHTWSRVDAETGPTDDFALLDGSSQPENIEALQDTIIRTPSRGPNASIPVHAQTWQGAAESLDTRIRAVEEQRHEHVVELAHAHAFDLRLGALFISVPALLVALASTAVAVTGTQRPGRGLQELRTQTLRHARFRLPEVTARLRAEQEVDVDTEAIVQVPVGLVGERTSSPTGPMRAPFVQGPLRPRSIPAPPPDDSSSDQDGGLPRRRASPVADPFLWMVPWRARRSPTPNPWSMVSPPLPRNRAVVRVPVRSGMRAPPRDCHDVADASRLPRPALRGSIRCPLPALNAP